MYFEISDNKKRFIKIELNKNDVEYLLKEKSITEFDSDNDIRIEIIVKSDYKIEKDI
jgi:hypothetical protein